MNFIKHISHSLFFATGAGGRKLRQLQWIAVCALLAAAAGLAQFNPRRAQTEPAAALHGEAAVRQLKTDGGYASLAAAMAAARYQINAAPAKSDQSGQSGAPFYANNPGQQLRATFASDEVRVSAASNKPDGKTSGKTDGKTDGAELRLRLAGYGYGDQLEPLAAGKLTANGDRIEIRKSQISNPESQIAEWYVNKPEGLEQGFTLAAPPAGERQSEWLRVALAVGDGWRASLRGDQQGAFFERRADGLRLSYDHLLASDAQGRTLPARMALDGGTLALLVDDAQAVYPLTIDPILTQQQKLVATNPPAIGGEVTVFPQFGRAVALSGDTAVVGASGETIGKRSAQGAAYVFIRSGASWIQQQKLTANDGAAEDFFGFSVALSGNTLLLSAPNDDIGANADQGSVYVFTRNGTVWTQQQKLTANDGAASDFFGQSVALSGDTVVVGAPNDDNGANADQGSAYVFTRSGAAWTQQRKLTANDGAASDFFGQSVALSGDTVVVGASNDDTGKNEDQGSAYVFTRSFTSSGAVWTQQQKLTANDGAGFDFFGLSVAVSGDTVVVSAFAKNIGANTSQGSAYVFTRSFTPSGAVWTQQQKLTAADGATNDFFGGSVALSGDTVVIGAGGDTIGANAAQGSAYVFSRSGAVWTQQQKLFAGDGGTEDEFGDSVALNGNTVVVGSPNNLRGGAAYVFVICANNQVQQQLTANDGAANDRFGGSVALSGDTVVVGAFFDTIGANTSQGSAYVFTRSGGVWTQQQRLIANDGAAIDLFGGSVALSGDTVVVGASGDDIGANRDQGSAYVFTRSGAVWTQQQKLIASDGAVIDFFGASVALSGDTVVVGASGGDIGPSMEQGSAYVFTRSGAAWTLQKKLTANDGAAGDQFGSSVALSGDTLVVGASNDTVGANGSQGSAYVFTRSGGLWTLQQKLTATDNTAVIGFGFSVALSGDTVVVGVLDDNSFTPGSQGAAYVFTRSGAVWTQQQKLIANDGGVHNYFSTSVAISGDTVVVGANFDTVGTNAFQGSVYVFTRSGVVWTPQQRLIANDGAASDSFGTAVAISGDTVVVGADSDDIGMNMDQGSAYVFVCPACPTITLNPASLPGGAIGKSYSQTMTASGGTGPYQFSLSDGALPPGLSLAQNGQLSGTPTTAGTYRFTLTATILSSLCPGSRSYTLIVTSPCPTITVNPAPPGGMLPTGVAGQPYNQTLTATGGAASFNFTISAGALPNGMSLSAAGSLSGAPTAFGAFNFTVRATDANGCFGTRAYALTIGSSACNFSVAPANHAFPSEGGAGVVSVNAADGCAWTAVSNDPMITITSGANGSGNGTVRFAVSKNPNAGSRRGALAIAGRKVTVVQAAPIACVSAASFARRALATESIVAAFGSGLAKSTEVATTQPLPATLAGTKVSVMDSLGTERLAPLFFVSPTQINFQVPPGTAAGKALVTIIREDETVAADSPLIEAVSPGLFSANASGQGLMIGVALRVKADGSQSFEPVVRFDEEKQQFVAAPINLDSVTDRVFLVLFATGLRNRASLGAVSVKIGGVNADALYAGPQGSFVGLDQLNVALPRSLAGRGEVELSVLVDGQEANKLKVAIK